jgi:GGDEF domain-containing protein
LGVTISIGVTALSKERFHLSALIVHANNAKNQAKQGQEGIVVAAP